MRALAPLILLGSLIGPAYADNNCDKSREYLLDGLGGELLLKPIEYDNLFKRCLETAAMSNVRDAYILMDGGIAVVPKQDEVAATAATLSQFCDEFPRATLHFLTKPELTKNKSLGDIVRIPSTSSSSCAKIRNPTE